MCIFVENIQNLKVYLEMEDNNQSIILIVSPKSKCEIFHTQYFSFFFLHLILYIYICS